MARVTPVRPKYWRKHEPVVYVDNKRMYFRSRAEKISNPRTEAQQANRSKMATASAFLAQMQPMVAKGFLPRMTNRPGWESRRVGAYHVALGELLNHSMVRDNGIWKIDYKRVSLSDGNSLEMYPLEVRRRGGEMLIRFAKGLPRGTQRVRLALHSDRRSRTLHASIPVAKKGQYVSISLPKWAKTGRLHIYYTVDVKGKSRWGSGYTFLAAGRSMRGWSLHQPNRSAYRFGNETVDIVGVIWNGALESGGGG